MTDSTPPSTANGRFQLINQHKEFSSDLSRHMADVWKTVNSGFDYHVVAVFGSQSTGKSTLLNRLFRTQFDVMSGGMRQQTTRGIWMGKAQDAPILVMDVEGTDGQERGEDQEFERRSALFSLSMAEVVIVNIWENMVGLYNGANMGLLKTVFEVNLQLFQHEGAPKTLLFFVIRDFIGQTPLESLKAVLRESLEKIWADINKPAGLESTNLETYFDFEYAALPHKILQADLFEKQAEGLRQRFIQSSKDGNVFHEKYHRHVPADGFHIYASSIWEKINSNKDLDLPTQQQLLAQYRCDEISNKTYLNFATELKPTEKQVDSGAVVAEFGKLAQLRDKMIDTFSKDAQRYHADVYARKRLDLMEKMNSSLHVLFIGQLRNLQKSSLHSFKATSQKIVAEDAENFAARLTAAQAEARSYFQKMSQDSLLPGTSWSNEEELKSFLEELDDFAARIRIEEMEKLVNKLTKSTLNSLAESVMSILAKSSRDTWARVYEDYAATRTKSESTFLSKIAGFEASKEETEEYVGRLRLQIWEVVKSKLKEETSEPHIQVRLRQKFEDAFRYTEDGLPRVWQQGENMDDIFIKSRDLAEELVTLLSKMPIPDDTNDSAIINDPDFDDEARAVILITPSKQRDLKDRLKKDADALFLEAKRGAVASLSEIPKGMWLLLLAFGFNEIYAFVSFILSNPAILFLLLILFASLVFLYQSGLLFPLARTAYASVGPASKVLAASAGPMVEATVAATAEFFQQVSEKLKNNTGADESPIKQGRDESPIPGTPIRPSSVASNRRAFFSTPFSTPIKKRTHQG